MKRLLIGFTVFAIMFALSVLLVSKVREEWVSPKQSGAQTQPVVPISKLRLHQIDEIRNALVDPAYRSKLEPWTETERNIRLITGHLRDGKSTYKIQLFPDMLSYTYTYHEPSGRVVIVRDYDLDGVVDYGVTNESGKSFREFDALKQTGLSNRRVYQDFYDEHSAVIANILGI